MTKMNWGKRWSGGGIEAAPKVWEEPKFGCVTGRAKQNAARRKAKENPQEPSAEVGRYPAWMRDRKLLPKKPPGRDQ